MAASPRIKFFSAEGKYVGSTHDYACGAAAVSVLGQGSTLRAGHSARDTFWVEGVDGEAANNFDVVADAMIEKGFGYLLG